MERILIVEDEGIVAMSLQLTLEHLGYRVVGLAHSATEAVKLAAVEQPDLVLMDIHLGAGADGIEAAAQITQARRTPVIFLTAYSEDATLKRARALGPYGYLLKPFSERELHASIQMAAERHRADTALARGEERLRLALDAAEMGMWELDIETCRVERRGLTDGLFGIDADAFDGSWNGLLARVAAQDREAVRQALAAAVANGSPLCTEFRVARAEGGERWLRVQAHSHGRPGPASRLIGVVQDISSRRDEEATLREAEDRLRHLAHHDPLTGLPNRLLAMDRLDQALARARRHRWRSAVMMVDLDHFKRINDTLGHAAGDELLCVVGSRLKTSLRAEDTVARLGGDEFVVILENIDREADIVGVAHKMLDRLGEPLAQLGCETVPSASVGVSIFPADADDRDGLMRAADTAMYAAKEAGRQRLAFYAPDMAGKVVA